MIWGGVRMVTLSWPAAWARLSALPSVRPQFRSRRCRRPAGRPHGDGAVEEQADVQPHHRRRNQAKEGESRIAAPDVARVLEEAPEAPLGGELGKGRAGVGDGDEALTRLGDAGGGDRLPEVGEVRGRLERRPRLAGDQEEGALDVEVPLQVDDRLGVGGVQDVKDGVSGGAAEGGAQHLRAEAGAAHAEEARRRRSPPAAPRSPAPVELRHPPAHGERDVEPAQPVADDRRVGRVGRLPEVGVPVPDALHDPARWASATTSARFGTPEARWDLIPPRPRRGALELLPDLRDQLVVRGGEGRRPRDQEVLGHLLALIPTRVELGDDLPGALDVVAHGVAGDRPWSRKASMVAGGMVSTVSGPISASA